MAGVRRRREPAKLTVDEALEQLDVAELRALLREAIDEAGERARGRLVARVTSMAARSAAVWTPQGPSPDEVERIVARVGELARGGYAHPSDADELLQRGSDAFLARDYDAAIQIFRPLFEALGNGEINLGQDETLDEVLGVDGGECAAQHAVAVYMTAPPEERPARVRAAIDVAHGMDGLLDPLRDMEAAAVEPLPGLDAFLPAWIALLDAEIARRPQSDWGSLQEMWRREAAGRLGGIAGLERLARETSRPDDLTAWCDALVDARDWAAALVAFEAAAERTPARSYWRGRFLDGAALAAQELGRGDVAERLGRAWREAPSVARLLRWLWAADEPGAIAQRVAEARASCPAEDGRQLALLHLLAGDVAAAAALLEEAPGLGWSAHAHPGALLFAAFGALLAGTPPDPGPLRDPDLAFEAGLLADPDEPRLYTPTLPDVLDGALADLELGAPTRAAMVDAMRAAAERRIAAVTQATRRSAYRHAAELVAACVAAAPTADSRQWAGALRTTASRYPALCRELDAALGR